MNTNWKGWWLALVMMMVMSCAAPLDDEVVSATLETDVEDGRADSSGGTWQVKTDGLTMWVDTVLEPRVAHGETFWTLNGRVSKTMTGFRAYTGAGYHYTAKMVSPRKFSITLSQRELLDVVAGARIYLDFFAPRGNTPIYHGTLRYAARFANWEGASSIFVYRAINPVYVGTQLTFRGRASTQSGYALDVVYTDDDAGPVLYDDEPKKYHFDWSPAALHLAADPPTDPVYFRGSDTAGTPVEKTATIEFRLVQMGLASDAPLATWPPERCTPEMRACLNALGSADTESCGWANEVGPCLGSVELPLAADPARFVADLREALRGWYETHEEDVRALNGRTLDAALAAVDEAHVGIVEDEEVDMLGYDPDHYDVFFHPDPVFRGSDRVWYGVYDSAGTLRHIEAVN